MKVYLSLIFTFFLINNSVYAQKIIKTILAENKDISIFIECNDTASIDQLDWLKFVVKNNSSDTVLIKNVNYSINTEIQSTSREIQLDYGTYGQGNEYDLFHFYYDFDNASDHRNELILLPNQSIISWKYLVNYTSVLLEGRKHSNLTTPLFKIDMSYEIANKEKKLENTGEKFSFYWKSCDAVSKKKLVQKLEYVMSDVHFRWVHTYTISFLMNIESVKNEISTEKLIDAIVKRNASMTDDANILFLNELKLRKVFYDRRLTDKYKQGLETTRCLHLTELQYYWDNSLLDNLLKCDANNWYIEAAIEVNARFWSSSYENRFKVYQYLKTQTKFDKQIIPNKDNFREWSRIVKTMSISRDTNIISYLLPYLDNQTEYEIEDYSNHEYSGMMPRNYKPVKINIRVCDVAFVSILRAIGQTEYVTSANIGTKYSKLSFKPDFFDVDTTNKNGLYQLEHFKYDLGSAEKLIKVSEISKNKIKAYIKMYK